MHQAKRGYVRYLLLIVMLFTTSPLLAAGAATVEFVWGMAYAVSISGEKRELVKGSRIDVGDTVVSETARVQLRFTDGGFVSLVPNSEFRVNAYSYSGKPDGSERIAMELMKGGLRTISGLIGKAIQSAYEMKTAVATIGIRGTEYTVVYGESVSGTVSAGAIAVCNAGGCLDVAHGQSYYIKDENTKPVFISKPALLFPRQPVIAGERNRDKVAERENTGARSEKVRGRESVLTIDDVNSQHDKNAMSQQTQAGDTLTAVALENSPLRVDDSPFGVYGKGPGKSFATANEHSRFGR